MSAHFGSEVAAAFGPFVGLSCQDGADEAGDGVAVGEDARRCRAGHVTGSQFHDRRKPLVIQGTKGARPDILKQVTY